MIISKSHPHSKIKRFHTNSNYADNLFGDRLGLEVLQVMELSKNELIVEVIDKDIYKEEN